MVGRNPAIFILSRIASSLTTASRERISAVVDLSNSSVFGIERIRELSSQITEAGNYAFDIIVLDRSTRDDENLDILRPASEVIVR
jgi:hypothetical protein